MASPLPDIFEYLDYREYLRDAYAALKASRRGFSYRAFAQKAGVGSPNFLKRIIDGDRNLTPTSLEKVAKALELSTRETEFFRDLVSFTQASSSADKNASFRKLGKHRKHRRVRKLERDMFDYLSRWYYPAIRELVTCEGFQDDPKWIANHVRPAITVAQARKAVDALLKLGLLVRDDDGRLQQGEALLSTGPEVRSLAIRNFHKQMIGRALDAIEDVPLEEREISGTTVALTEEGFRLFKERIHALRAELLELSATEKGPKRVIQFNFQAFPLADSTDANHE
ncbi:MAG: TIGR02147 family protein [Rhodothermales bacterium]|nr:TIGR02147 family protein [Deltaproteobacteria bacterium]NNE35845.1 TIGR02147 family protein [Rhodothermales bacterium]